MTADQLKLLVYARATFSGATSYDAARYPAVGVLFLWQRRRNLIPSLQGSRSGEGRITRLASDDRLEGGQQRHQ